ncbi:inorganic diphosphatase [Actinopolyspora halophila]|uniref:inorganic diphosphatase n=1 Tax=Actinopolyspora halophila TaxID=1850 RepID=UPI0003727006|nr:inorganic diphosphatase [Actinopolyspora halophila]
MNAPSPSLHLARGYLGRRVHLRIDRPAGSTHPQHGFDYPVNYGYLPGVPAPDGDNLDAYYLNTDPVTETEGLCVAVIHRYCDDDDKLVIVDDSDTTISDDEIHQRIAFQELPGHYEIIRAPAD